MSVWRKRDIPQLAQLARWPQRVRNLFVPSVTKRSDRHADFLQELIRLQIAARLTSHRRPVEQL
ncbi:hypothetical protein K443DRAFT_673200 [Laccaria amethystina LaAM-08-1]|uniref:Uncharacterized protein n=1 Tax=Laccaria amethystina LaAM-08-1 TaxID=1095629 RepID=A0A0C9Y153_9AGAR|nr:hypothetical protein K443DRAFT_673200 [Laccaria amethystina LaAM-08-1]